MSDNAPGIQNKTLLAVAVVLAAIVVVLFNVDRRMRSSSSALTATRLRLLRDIAPGQKIKSEDLEWVGLTKDVADALNDVVDPNAENGIKEVTRYPVNQWLYRGKWLRWDNLPNRDESSPAANITQGMVARALPLDERLSPGEILRVGGRVNILAELPDGKGGFTACRVIEGVRVHNIGGQGQAEGAVQSGAGKTAYRTITVELTKDVSIELQNILTHARRGVFQIEVVNPREPLAAGSAQINKDVKRFAAVAAPSPAPAAPPATDAP